MTSPTLALIHPIWDAATVAWAVAVVLLWAFFFAWLIYLWWFAGRTNYRVDVGSLTVSRRGWQVVALSVGEIVDAEPRIRAQTWMDLLPLGGQFFFPYVERWKIVLRDGRELFLPGIAYAGIEEGIEFARTLRHLAGVEVRPSDSAQALLVSPLPMSPQGEVRTIDEVASWGMDSVPIAAQLAWSAWSGLLWVVELLVGILTFASGLLEWSLVPRKLTAAAFWSDPNFRMPVGRVVCQGSYFWCNQLGAATRVFVYPNRAVAEPGFTPITIPLSELHVLDARPVRKWARRRPRSKWVVRLDGGSGEVSFRGEWQALAYLGYLGRWTEP